MYCSVCWVIFRWWLLFLCGPFAWLFFSSCTHHLCEHISLKKQYSHSKNYQNSVREFFKQLKFKSNWLQIVSISLLFISLCMFVCVSHSIVFFFCRMFVWPRELVFDEHFMYGTNIPRFIFFDRPVFKPFTYTKFGYISNCWIVLAIKWKWNLVVMIVERAFLVRYFFCCCLFCFWFF